MNQRQLSFGAVTTKTVWGIIIFNTLCFILQLSFKEITPLFALYTKDVFPFRIYTIFTYSLLHGSFSHLFLICFRCIFWWSGSTLSWYKKIFYNLHFLCNIWWAFLSFIYEWLLGCWGKCFYYGSFDRLCDLLSSHKSFAFLCDSSSCKTSHLPIYGFEHLFFNFWRRRKHSTPCPSWWNSFPHPYCNKLWRIRYWFDEIKYKIKRRKFKVMK